MNPIHATKRSLAYGAACIVVLSLLLTLGCGADTPAQASGSDENTNILRLHVIANSDTAADQAVKLKVRDAVLACVAPGGSAEETENFLLRHGKELQAAVQEAQEANAAKSRFLSNMSHDIRTPMNAIIGMTDIALAHTDSPERMVDCLYKIRQASGHLLSLINNVLDMSRIESGKVELHKIGRAHV